MVRVFVVLLLIWNASWSNDVLLKEKCLNCHVLQQIPSHLIYKRYLLKYSTKESMADALFEYLKNPIKIHSIMPPEFFLKFPQKEKLDYSDRILKKRISEYLDYFDVKNRLYLGQ